MKSITKILICFLLTCVTIDVCFSQAYFRIKTLNNHEYILPPYTNLKFRNSKVKRQFKYLYFWVVIREGYEATLNERPMMEVAQGKHDYFDKSRQTKKLAKKIQKKDDACLIKPNTHFHTAFLNADGTEFFIQINMEDLNSGDPVENYYKLAYELFNGLTLYETTKCPGSGAIDWPDGISQYVVKSLFDLIPMPVEAQLARWCYAHKDNDRDLILLDEDLPLKIDDVEKIIRIDGSDDHFKYVWRGTNLFGFQRNESGKIVQNHFSLFDSGLPNNLIDEKVYLISSFADIQNSSVLKDLPYIVLCHPKLKRNNDEKSDTGIYTPGADQELGTSTAFLIHLSSLEAKTFNFSLFVPSDQPNTKSVFGNRHSITPVIKVVVNNQSDFLPLKTKIKHIRELPWNYKLERKYRGTYRKVNGNKRNLFLFPNDHISYEP